MSATRVRATLAITLFAVTGLPVSAIVGDDVYTPISGTLTKVGTLTWCHKNEPTQFIQFTLTNQMDRDRIGSTIQQNFYATAYWYGGIAGFCNPPVHASSSKWYASGTGLSTVTAVLTDVDNNPATDDNDTFLTMTDSVGGFEMASITVTTGATKTNVTGAKNWAAVKGAGNTIVRLYLNPDLEAPAVERVTWTGGTAGANARQRLVSKGTSAKTNVKAASGGYFQDLDVWIIWSTLQIRTTGSLSGGNDASGLQAGSWPAPLGGGTGLGSIDKETTSLTYAYTVGRIEAKATLQPIGIEDVIDPDSWGIRRRVTVKAWDNGGLPSAHLINADDTSVPAWLDLDPKSGTSAREIYDLDAPGNSCTLMGTTIDHTAEVYANFDQWVTVTLDATEVCSDIRPWSYQARVDIDKPTNKVELNSLSTSHIAIPQNAHYSTR